MPTGARKNSVFKAVSLVPNVCKTPMGPNMVPVPYPIVADLNDSVDVVISNCVLNLVPHKARAFAETARVLRPRQCRQVNVRALRRRESVPAAFRRRGSPAVRA